jgi:hypothetical protein
MPIRWSTQKVSGAADMVEEFVNQAAEPLAQMRIVAQEARRIPHLPQYVDDCFRRLLGEIERAIGGGRLDEKGRLRATVQSIRERIPKGTIEAERENTKHGTTQSLM